MLGKRAYISRKILRDWNKEQNNIMKNGLRIPEYKLQKQYQLLALEFLLDKQQIVVSAHVFAEVGSNLKRKQSLALGG